MAVGTEDEVIEVASEYDMMSVRRMRKKVLMSETIRRRVRCRDRLRECVVRRILAGGLWEGQDIRRKYFA